MSYRNIHLFNVLHVVRPCETGAAHLFASITGKYENRIKSEKQAAKGCISIGDQIRAVNGANGTHDMKLPCKIILEFLQKSKEVVK